MTHKTPNAPIVRGPEGFRQERRALFRIAAFAVIVCLAGLAAGYALLPSLFEFPVALQDRLVFWARTQVFLFVWVLAGVGMVSRGRRQSIEDISGSAYGPPSERIAVPVAFLQNSLEQAVLASSVYLALVTLVSGASLALIVSAVILFCAGRVTFLMGYSRGAHGRGFGFVLCILPTMVGFVWAAGLIVMKIL